MKNLITLMLITIFSTMSTASTNYRGKTLFGHWESENGRSTVLITKAHHGIYIENLRNGNSVFYHKTGKSTFKHRKTKVKWHKNDNTLIVKKKHKSAIYYYPVVEHKHRKRDRLDGRNGHTNIDGTWFNKRDRVYVDVSTRRNQIVLYDRTHHDHNVFYRKKHKRNVYVNDYGETLEYRSDNKMYIYTKRGPRIVLKRSNKSRCR